MQHIENGDKVVVRWSTDGACYKARIVDASNLDSIEIVWALSNGNDWLWPGGPHKVTQKDVVAVLSEFQFWDQNLPIHSFSERDRSPENKGDHPLCFPLPPQPAMPSLPAHSVDSLRSVSSFQEWMVASLRQWVAESERIMEEHKSQITEWKQKEEEACKKRVAVLEAKRDDLQAQLDRLEQGVDKERQQAGQTLSRADEWIALREREIAHAKEALGKIQHLPPQPH